jgi:hypothetical protein
MDEATRQYVALVEENAATARVLGAFRLEPRAAQPPSADISARMQRVALVKFG